MVVKELIAELRKLPADVDVHFYASECWEVQPIDRVHFNRATKMNRRWSFWSTKQRHPCIQGRSNCCKLFECRALYQW